MTRLFWAAVLFVLAERVAASASSGVETSVRLAQTTFLSTQEPQATVAIVNNSESEVVLDQSAITIATFSGGSWHRGPYWYWGIWRTPPARIAPGARRDVRVRLPSCQVLSDPCSETVRLGYTIKSGESTHAYDVQLPQYWFVPDPAVTYRDVPDGLPVIISFGSAEASVVPTTVIIGVTTAPVTQFSSDATPPPIFSDASKTLNDAGITISKTTYEPDNPTWYYPLVSASGELRKPNVWKANAWRAIFTVNNGGSELDKINAAMNAIRQRLGDRISRIGAGFTGRVDDTSYPALWQQAENDADPSARRLALTLHCEDPGRGTRSATSLSFQNVTGGPYDPYTEVVSPVLKPAKIGVRVRVQMTYVGSSPSKLHVAPALVAQSKGAFQTPIVMASMAPGPTMAADRPELYVVGGASARAALRRGLDPETVALLNAQARTLELARILGVRPGAESLFALYRPDPSEDQAIGVATTFAGNYRIPQAKSRGGSAVQIFHFKGGNGLVNVPIGIPNPESTLVEQSTAQIMANSDILLFEMEVDSGAGRSGVNLAAITQRLRSVSGAIGATVKTTQGGLFARFDVLLRRSSRSSLARLADVVHSSYEDFSPAMSFDLQPFISDCTPLNESLLTQTLNRNFTAARQDARASGNHLRKLLLVAAAPPSNGTACGPVERDPGPLPYDRLQDIPQVMRTPYTFVTSLVVFRTSPGVRRD